MENFPIKTNKYKKSNKNVPKVYTNPPAPFVPQGHQEGSKSSPSRCFQQS